MVVVVFLDRKHECQVVCKVSKLRCFLLLPVLTFAGLTGSQTQWLLRKLVLQKWHGECLHCRLPSSTSKKKKKVSGQVMSFDKPCDWNFKGVMIWQTYVTMTLHAPTLPPHPPPPTIIPVPLFKPLNCLPLVSVYNCKYYVVSSEFIA